MICSHVFAADASGAWRPAADGLPPIVYEQQVMTARTAARTRLQEPIAA
jgi:hypothetical protein